MRTEAKLVGEVVVVRASRASRASSSGGCCCPFLCSTLSSSVQNQAWFCMGIMNSIAFYILWSNCGKPTVKIAFFDRVTDTSFGHYVYLAQIYYSAFITLPMSLAALLLWHGVVERKPHFFLPYTVLFPTMIVGYACSFVAWGVAAVKYVAPLQAAHHGQPSQRVISPAEVIALVILALLLLIAVAVYCMVNVVSLYRHYRHYRLTPQSAEGFDYID